MYTFVPAYYNKGKLISRFLYSLLEIFLLSKYGNLGTKLLEKDGPRRVALTQMSSANNPLKWAIIRY